MESPLLKLETLQKRYTELLADMKRLERDHGKSKKRADQLQKERDHGRSELSKTVSMKEKLEKLCREFTRENKKVKVRKKLEPRYITENHQLISAPQIRMNTRGSRTARRKVGRGLERKPSRFFGI